MTSAAYEASKAGIEAQLRRWMPKGSAPDAPLTEAKFLLFFGMGAVRTLEPLAEFPWLRALEFRDCSSVPDLSVVGKLPELARITVHKGRMKGGGAAIARHPAIVGLTLTSPLPEGLDDLPPRLDELTLHDPKLTALPLWPGLAHVRTLRLDGTQLPSFEALPSMPLLTRLTVNEVKPVASCAGLSRAPALEVLEANFSGIADLRGIEALPGLRELRLRACPFTDLTPAFACRGLRTLYVEKSGIRSVEGVAEAWPELELLWVWDTRVHDLAPLAGLASLREADLSLMKPKSWEFLRSLRAIETLDLSDSTFDDLGLLADLPALRWLRVPGKRLPHDDPRVAAFDAVLFARGGGLTGSGVPYWKAEIRRRHEERPQP